MSDGAAGFTALGLLPAAHEQSDNRHRSIAIVPAAIAGSLKLLAFSAVTSQMPETTAACASHPRYSALVDGPRRLDRRIFGSMSCPFDSPTIQFISLIELSSQ